MNDLLKKVHLPADLAAALEACNSITIPATRRDLYELSLGAPGVDRFDVEYEVPGKGLVKEADVVRCTNGIAVNYPEDYIRRRDPDCMRIADNLPSDKPRFKDRHGEEFAQTKAETLAWLSEQELLVVPFKAGSLRFGYASLAVMPRNAAFFATALVDLQVLSRWMNCRNSRRVRSCTSRRPSATRTSTASRSWCTTAQSRCTRSLPTTFTPDPARRRAFSRPCSTSATKRVG